MINFKKDKTPLDASWRAAWDMWHCWMVQNYLAVLPVDGVLLHPIFVTGDNAVAFVAGRCLPGVVFGNSGQPCLSTSEVDPHFPYYADCLERLRELLRSRATASHARIARDVAKGRAFDQERIEAEIERLERVIQATWQMPPAEIDTN
ncbi:MAG: hypothetical protein ACRD2X_03230 [Vicinamibacteraceae bacterium]